MIGEVVTDSGPPIHLAEVGADRVWELFEEIRVPDIVSQEVTARPLPGAKTLAHPRFQVVATGKAVLALARKLGTRHYLARNDALVLAHACYGATRLLLTDDLEVRTAAKREGMIPVGTVGLLLRAHLQSIYSYAQLIELLDRTLASSLYITADVVEEVKRAAWNPDH